MEVKNYFQSYEHYFWEWVTDEDVPDPSGYDESNLVSIPNVGAIAYRHYIVEVLKELKDQGLPPFGSLLLVLYALQDGYLNMDGLFYHLNRQMRNPVGEEIRNDIESAINFLENLNSVGDSFKRGQNKILLLRSVFKDSHNLISFEASHLMIKRFEKRPYLISEAAVQNHLNRSVVSKDFKILALLHKKFPTTDAIIDSIKDNADLPELEDGMVEEPNITETGKDFIQELIEEPKTFQVGSLIKRIWSGLKIPMRHLSPGEQQIGGISDMTNKGDFHRMLLSEFANEDEVFMNRVANNETLYMQREIPPEENIFERIILIDTSLKNWGTPKVLAFASAIAVIKHPKANSECKVFTLGQTMVPVSLDTTEQVIENLHQVSPVLEVSETLEKFFNDEHIGKDLEVFFITHQENVAHGNLQKVIHENRDRLKFLVTTSSDGELNFFRHQKGTRKHIQKILLPLKELWANPPKQKSGSFVYGNGIKALVPVNYPILFPTPKDRIAVFLYEGEFYMLSNKKQLLRTYLSDNYYNKNIYQNSSIERGCEVLMEDISVRTRGYFALARNKSGNYVLAQYQPDRKILSRLNLNTKEYSELNLTGQNIPLGFTLMYFDKNFYLHNENALLIFKISIEGSISMEQVSNKHEISKSDLRSKSEMQRLRYRGIKILNNFTGIGINASDELVIAKWALMRKDEHVYKFDRNTQNITVWAGQNKNRFTFEDGSEIITDHRGMVTFISSNKNIPTFYLPSTYYGYLALATEKEFGGSEYYLPKETKLKVREMDDMYSDYMEAYIKHILEYGT
ncbi:hypothetical protein MKJ01_07860 [Chryseobacterium sp. SSA4.19]|uniref:hypothetical protein n=1 Tax=Chryseobacterium sp. SSA4.19 TaxID=2919915 RepID=UPI001F4EEDCE|nr:hypothetical protein [Chryseobacterium sp. SSA4.19]MCJ8153678.1 hypothetical protein [Chryseobacterium sp. SSA4.19]